jgi:hypothetical protein
MGQFRRSSMTALLPVFLALGSSSALAQSGVARDTTAAAYVSVSGMATFGFARSIDPRAASTDIDVLAILPPGSDVAAAARPLIEKMWRTSPTFRRQCARLIEASAALVVTLDYPRHIPHTNALSTIRRDGGLRAHIRLRGADPRGAEILAHEIEHVLEQADGVDLPVALAGRVHGASLVRRPDFFETRRATVVGRIVAREVAGDGHRR